MAKEQEQDVPRRLELRKYPNRRYYDSTRSRHVTLEEIYALIREGYEVRVTDSKSGQDITAKVLAQIIIELDAPKLGVFPVPLLHRLLRSNERMVNDFVQRYFSAPLMAFLDSQRSFEDQFRRVMGVPSPVPTMADLTKMMWGPFGPAVWGEKGVVYEGDQNAPAAAGQAGTNGATGAPNAPPQPPAEEGSGGRADLERSVEELRRQLAELQARMGEGKAGMKGDRAGAARKGRVKRRA